MINNIKTNLKTLHDKNLSLNGTNLSVNSQNSSLNDKNSSLIRHVAAMVTKLEETTKFRLLLSVEKKGCNRGVYPFLSVFLVSKNIVKQLFTTDDNKRYHSLTTNCSAAKPSRHSLAIFMSKICLTNYQRFTNDINTNISALQTSHKYSTDTIGANIYDGLSGPNKIPLVGNKPRRLNTVVNNLSPFFLGGNKLTKCSGAIHNG
ncbi:hypothetical protein [Psychrobacter sp.]|uniref:hypothetical protein n=1 Tax=Psychrobacter sp. TaxID=56811 RepID=UPI00356AD34C